MKTLPIHRHLQRQINKYLTPEFLSQSSEMMDFIAVVNQTYINYDKDAELFEQSAKLNDREYTAINLRIKQELERKQFFQGKLVEAIKQLSDKESSPANADEDDLMDLLTILTQEIEFKKEYQQQLVEAKSVAETANEAKSDFLSLMSHELRTPLNAIIGLTYIMEQENSLESLQENLGTLKHSAQNLFLLINDILDFNKIEAGKIELEKINFNFRDLVLQIAKSFEVRASENLNQLEVLIDDNFMPNMSSDPLRIGQILNNLLSNALKFTSNGKVQIKVSQIALLDKISTFKVEVIDTGIGIEKDNYKKIFKKFSQADNKTSRKYGGTGLGLVITQRLLHLLGSDIAFESEIGTGSNFYFTLSLPVVSHSQTIDSQTIQDSYQEINLRGLKVLLVEDNLINIKIAQKIMQKWDVEVDLAENGLVALDKFAQNSYHIILMDLSMPVMDGYEATTEIRKTDKLVPIIALSASASFGYLDRALQIGINEYIIKPFNPKELNMKLHKYANFSK
jgi:signal transduction histidine kinase